MKDFQQDKKPIPQKKGRPLRDQKSLHLLTREQTRALLTAVKGHHDEALLMLALVGGLRAGEWLALQWQVLDWEGEQLLIHQTLPARHHPPLQSLFLPAKHSRMLLLPPMVRDSLQQHALRQQEQAGDTHHHPVICATDGTPLSADRLTPLIEKHLRRAHLPPLRFHELRQSTAYLLLLAGGAPETIHQILGIGWPRGTGDDQGTSFSSKCYQDAR